MKLATIAVVDDDSSLLKALGRLLVSSGFHVELFASAAELLNAIPESQAACFVIDCQLGHVSGITLARQLTEAGLQVPVIFMTGSDDDSIRSEAMLHGCVAFLRKPFFANELLGAIKRATLQAEPHVWQAAELDQAGSV